MADTTLTFDILARDRASRDFDRIGRRSDNLGSKLGKLAGIAAGAAVIGGVTLLTGFIKDAAEAAKISRITENAIKATGGAANVTAAQVGDLAERLSNLTAVDDELIQTGSNLLLTFKNVRNEVGKGNDIFDQANALMLDLSAAGFGSVDSAAKMLGKALNDPLKGLTALSKAGVTFSEDQKKMITDLVETGDLLGAQRIILEEIASQVGGAAEAAADPMERLKTIAGNLGEEIGAVLLPYVEQFATWLVDEGVPKIEDAIATFRDDWIPVIKDVWGDIQDNLIPVLEKVIGFVTKYKDFVWLLIPALVAWKVAQIAVNVAMSVNPLIAFITLVTTAIGIFMAMNEVTGDWHKTLETLGQFIASVPILGPLFQALSDLDQAFEDIKGNIARTLEAILRGAFEFAIVFAQTIIDMAESAFGWIPGMDEKFATAREAVEDFRRKVNIELSKISDEDIKINIKPGGIERVTKSVAASAAARFSGMPGGGYQPTGSIYTGMPTDATGGSLGIRTTGLNPDKIGMIAARIGDQAGDKAFAEMRRLFKAGAFATMFEPSAGIPGSGRLFPLPPGTYRRTQGPHDGGAIDYGAPFGTPIRASFSGSLQYGDLGNRSYGKFYRLFGPGQRSILGAHLSSFARSNGPVARGQLVGRVGSTGNSTGPHLHLLGFDKGGWLPPGMSLAYNGTGRPERILPPANGHTDSGGVTFGGDIHMHGVQDMSGFVAELQRYAKRNGGIRLKVATP